MKPRSVVADGKLSLYGQAPVTIRPIFDGNRLLAYKLFTEKEVPTGVKITGMSPDGPLTVELSITDHLEGSFVHQLAARKRIQVREIMLFHN